MCGTLLFKGGSCASWPVNFWGGEFTPRAMHPASLVPRRSFMSCCLRRGVSRCEHRSKGSRGPGPSQGQCFMRKTERSRGARRWAGRSAARARGDEAAVDGWPLAQPPSENSQPRSSLETRPPIISTFQALLRGPLHPHPTSISVRPGCSHYHTSQSLSLLSSNPSLASALKQSQTLTT